MVTCLFIADPALGQLWVLVRLQMPCPLQTRAPLEDSYSHRRQTASLGMSFVGLPACVPACMRACARAYACGSVSFVLLTLVNIRDHWGEYGMMMESSFST